MIAPNNTPESEDDGEKPAPEEDGSVTGTALRARGSRDTRLIARAIRERWPIPEALREPLIRRQYENAIDPESTKGESTKAFNSLLNAEKQNMEADKLALQIAGLLDADPFTTPLPPPDSDATPAGNNVQVVVVMPDNGRGPTINVNGNGHAGNGSN